MMVTLMLLLPVQFSKEKTGTVVRATNAYLEDEAKLKAKYFTSQVSHGAGAYLRFL